MSVDQQAYEEVAHVLFGDGAHELIAKFSPGSSDLHVKTSKQKKDNRTRKITAALSGVGATAGAAGLGYAGHKTGQAYRKARLGGAVRRGAALRTAIKHEKFGTALIPLEVAGLGGEVLATKILHGDVKKKPVVKRYKTKELASLGNEAVGRTSEYKKTKQRKRKLKAVALKEIGKSLDIQWEGEISKVDVDKRQVFGWASVSKIGGEDVIDKQGDYISMDEVEKAAYKYVNSSRIGGDMHQREGEKPLAKSNMIESFVVTPEKLSKMGLAEDAMPHGWWVGYQCTDDDLWQMVKDGRRVGFSIHGKGVRTPMEA